MSKILDSSFVVIGLLRVMIKVGWPFWRSSSWEMMIQTLGCWPWRLCTRWFGSGLFWSFLLWRNSHREHFSFLNNQSVLRKCKKLLATWSNKVNVVWECHKLWKNYPQCFDVYLVNIKILSVGDFFKLTLTLRKLDFDKRIPMAKSNTK